MCVGDPWVDLSLLLVPLTENENPSLSSCHLVECGGEFCKGGSRVPGLVGITSPFPSSL